jgi:phosphoribosylaminoimidazole-succinocarboxamide synthase
MTNDLGLAHLYSGKVRDLYEVGTDHLLMVASDRLSAFDVVMNEPIPHKGRVLTALTQFWVNEFAGQFPSALVSCDPQVIDTYVAGFANAHSWHGRAMLVRRAQMLPLECIVRARLAGHAFEEYQLSGTVGHVSAPAGMQLTDAFAEPIFTPSTKAETGHDEYIDLDAARDIVGAEALSDARALCLDLFTKASARLAEVGLVLADTKFELGYIDGSLVLCDEVLTPDSSRIWPADAIVSGHTPPSFDKQPFRDWLATLSWDRTPPPPAVPAEIVEITSRRYVAAYENVTGRSLDDWYGQ